MEADTPRSEEFRKNQDQVKTNLEKLIEEKCREVQQDEDMDVEKIGLRTRRIRVLLGLPNASFYNYSPHLLLDEEYESISYQEQKGIKIVIPEFLEELD